MSGATASYVRILNGYFTQPDYFKADVEKGTIRTPAGVRMCALTDDFLQGFRAALQFECGKATDRVMKSCGKKWGKTFIERFDRELSEYFGVPLTDMSAGIVEKCLNEAFRAHGWGNITIDYSEYDNGLVQVAITDSVMPDVIGKTDKLSDALMCGFLATVFSHYANTELECHQTECPSRGADASRFVVGLASRVSEVPKWIVDNLNHGTMVRRIIANTPK
jgi:uncharacterized protein